MKEIRSAFVTGFLVLVPLLATIQLLMWFFKTIDTTIRSVLPDVAPLNFWGAGLLLVLMLIFLTGLLTHNLVGRLIIDFFDHLIRKAPVVGGIYGSIKKFLETIFHPGSDQFHGTVLVEFPRKGVYSVGFRTGKPDAKLQPKTGEPFTNVFVPCTPNPTSGFYILVPETELITLDLSVQEAFKIVISMGIVTSEEAKKQFK